MIAWGKGGSRSNQLAAVMCDLSIRSVLALSHLCLLLSGTATKQTEVQVANKVRGPTRLTAVEGLSGKRG